MKNIKVLAAAILIGVGAISSGFASDSESDQEGDKLRRFFYPSVDGEALAESSLAQEHYNLLHKDLFLMRDFDFTQLDYIQLSLSKDSVRANEENIRAEKKGCLPFVPTDLLAHILKFLPPAKYEEAGAVCKRFYRITRSRALLPQHLNSYVHPDSCLSLNINILTDLGAILADTVGNNDERALRMEAFEQNHLVEIKTAFRVLKFYHSVLDLKSLCPGDISWTDIREPYVNFKLNSNKFLSQHVLQRSGRLIELIGCLVNNDDFPLLTIKPYLQNCVALLSPLVEGTQTSFNEDLLGLFALPIVPAAFLLPLPLAAPIAPPVLAPVVVPADNNNDANDDQEDEE